MPVHLLLVRLQPHFNKIKTLWRKTNYERLRPKTYANFKTLKTAFWHILDRVGRQHTIQFVLQYY